jgi:hypothetical protein
MRLLPRPGRVASCRAPWPAAALALAILALASVAMAAPKKGAKPKHTDSTGTTPPAASSTAAPEAAPPAPESSAAPATSAAESTPSKAEAKPSASAGGEATEKAAPDEVDITDTREDPAIRYYFLGLRYRGTIVPQFLENLFVDEGGTVYSNTFGVELDMRKGGQSMIPWIVYQDYSMGDTLFHQKGQSTIPGNYSVVNSSIKMITIGLDELWSAPIDQAHHWDFEFGFGVGVGFVFGDLMNNWVFEDMTNGTLKASTGKLYSACQQVSQGTGCSPADHQNATIAKVDGYKEPFWFSGGSVPSIFPNVWFPQLGIRYKPIKMLETRLGVGFSLTGFWFGLSADYGFEQPEKKGGVKASGGLTRLRDML